MSHNRRPFVGRVIHLDAAQHIQVRMDKDICRIKIHDHTRKRASFILNLPKTF